MKGILRDTLGFVVGAAVIAAYIYFRWKTLQGRVKDLGDGRIQTLFGDKQSK
jgi:hypothetical protein